MKYANPWVPGLVVLCFVAAGATAAEPARPKKARPDAIPNLPKLQKLVTAAPTSRGVKVGPNKSRPVSTVPIQDDALESMVTELGYEVQVNTHTDPAGNERKYVSVCGANYWMDVYLWGGDAYDDQVILTCKLLDVPDLAQVPAEKLADLLTASDSYYGHIMLQKDDAGAVTVMAIKGIANLNLSPALMQRTIDNFDQFIVDTKAIWSDNNWTK